MDIHDFADLYREQIEKLDPEQAERMMTRLIETATAAPVDPVPPAPAPWSSPSVVTMTLTPRQVLAQQTGQILPSVIRAVAPLPDPETGRPPMSPENVWRWIEGFLKVQLAAEDPEILRLLKESLDRESRVE